MGVVSRYTMKGILRKKSMHLWTDGLMCSEDDLSDVSVSPCSIKFIPVQMCENQYFRTNFDFLLEWSPELTSSPLKIDRSHTNENRAKIIVSVHLKPRD